MDRMEHTKAAWKLVWADEFDSGTQPDLTKWGYESGYLRNNELQYYTVERSENARLENSKLILEARREQFPLPDKPGEFGSYTSASLRTKGKAFWKYGRVEVKAKIPTGRGMWPAIWMMPNLPKIRWPNDGEIDIMENVGFNPDEIIATVHTEAYNHMIKTQKSASIKDVKPYADFHVYAIEWSENKIDFFMDDLKYFSYANEGTGDAAWPFNKPFYLIINIAVGGGWGGQKGIDDSIFPQRFEVDYVRVYERA